MRLIALTLFVIAIAAFGSFVVFGQRQPPVIGRDLPATYAEGEKVFDARIKAHYPVGGDPKIMANDLRRQGFEVLETESGGSAHFSDKGFPIASIWSVGWDIEAGKLSNVWGILVAAGPDFAMIACPA